MAPGQEEFRSTLGEKLQDGLGKMLNQSEASSESFDTPRGQLRTRVSRSLDKKAKRRSSQAVAMRMNES